MSFLLRSFDDVDDDHVPHFRLSFWLSSNAPLHIMPFSLFSSQLQVSSVFRYFWTHLLRLELLPSKETKLPQETPLKRYKANNNKMSENRIDKLYWFASAKLFLQTKSKV